MSGILCFLFLILPSRCIFFEFLTGKPFVELKAGDHEFDALCKIFKRLGLPSVFYAFLVDGVGGI